MIKQLSKFLEKAIGRMERLDPDSIATVLDHLKRQYAFLETLFNTIHDGVLVMDDRNRIGYINRAATLMLGFSADQLSGRNDGRFLPESIRRSLEADGRGEEGRVHQFDTEIDYPEKRHLRVTVVCLDRSRSEAEGAVLILQDDTQRLREKQEAVESERGHALHLLAASVAHEVGNPLNALQIHFQLAEREIDKLGQPERESTAKAMEKLGRYIRVARKELTRLDYTVREFLGAVRPIRPVRKPIDLNWVVEDTVQLLGPELENRGLHVLLRLDEKPVRALLDPGQMKQILINLIKNAMQAMKSNGQLTLGTSGEESGVWLRVEDTGPGISRDQLPQIFDPYYTTRETGAGLGLMIVHQIVEQHQGKIHVDQDGERGVRFRIWLPHEPVGPPLLRDRPVEVSPATDKR